MHCVRCRTKIQAGLLCSQCEFNCKKYIEAVSEVLQAGVPLDKGSVHNAKMDKNLLERHRAKMEADMPAPVDFWTTNSDGQPVCIMLDFGKSVLASADSDKLTKEELIEAMAQEYPTVRLDHVWTDKKFGYVYALGEQTQ